MVKHLKTILNKIQTKLDHLQYGRPYTVSKDNIRKISIEDRPLTYNTMMWTFTSLNGKKSAIHTFLTDLKTIHTEQHEDHTIFTYEGALKTKLPKNILECWVLVTDDPDVEWAGDWRHIGCFSLMWKLSGKITVESTDPLKLKATEFEKHCIRPDRTY